MSMTDPIADLLTRIRNGQQARLGKISTPVSKIRVSILDVLKKEGYIRDYKVEKPKDSKFLQAKIALKYTQGDSQTGTPVIEEIVRISKPGCRRYATVSNLPKVRNGLGIYILSTPKGVMSDHEARENNVGGEVLCTVY